MSAESNRVLWSMMTAILLALSLSVVQNDRVSAAPLAGHGTSPVPCGEFGVSEPCVLFERWETDDNIIQVAFRVLWPHLPCLTQEDGQDTMVYTYTRVGGGDIDFELQLIASYPDKFRAYVYCEVCPMDFSPVGDVQFDEWYVLWADVGAGGDSRWRLHVAGEEKWVGPSAGNYLGAASDVQIGGWSHNWQNDIGVVTHFQTIYQKDTHASWFPLNMAPGGTKTVSNKSYKGTGTSWPWYRYNLWSNANVHASNANYTFYSDHHVFGDPDACD